MNAIKRFNVDTRGLSAKEKIVLKKLILAAELIAPLYTKQKNDKYPGANFYPHGVSREEILKAAKKNPAIMSPYTFVGRNEEGNLTAVPFHVKFKKELEGVAKVLKEASHFCQDKKLKNYLIRRAKDLLTDNYDKSNILWLKTEHSKIGFVIGSFDRYLDKLFFKKRAFMAWVGILDTKQTKCTERLKTMALSSERKYLPGAKKTKIHQVKVRVEDTALFSGLITDFMFVSNNLPSSADLHLIKKYGTLFTIFSPSTRRRFERQILPIFKIIFEKDIQKKYPREELYRAFFRSNILHETSHSLMRYEDATVRLQEFFPFLDEIYTEILGVKIYGSLLLKGVVTQKDLEAFLIVYICQHLQWVNSVSKQTHIVHYATGGAISLNFLLEAKALKKKGNFFWPDFGKLFICIDQLSHILEYYLALGNYNEVKEFIKKYGSFRLFQKYFLPKLRKIPSKL
jgi:hypothetical protein